MLLLWPVCCIDFLCFVENWLWHFLLFFLTKYFDKLTKQTENINLYSEVASDHLTFEFGIYIYPCDKLSDDCRKCPKIENERETKYLFHDIDNILDLHHEPNPWTKHIGSIILVICLPKIGVMAIYIDRSMKIWFVVASYPITIERTTTTKTEQIIIQ